MSVLFVEMDRSNAQNSLNNVCGSTTTTAAAAAAAASTISAAVSALNQQKKQQQQLLSPSSSSSVVGNATVNSIEEQRALQLAFELSMLGLSDSLSTCNVNGVVGGNGGNDMMVNMVLSDVNNVCHQQQQQQQQQQHQHQQIGSRKIFQQGGFAASNATLNDHQQQQQFSRLDESRKMFQQGGFANINEHTTTDPLLPNLDDRSKKSQNMTECVPVPSSEHVAEIVGRQGCKIKALRAKTNTYIKTPVRGEEPVFVVTGRKEDVSKAKREILSAAEHFSLIRASRKPPVSGVSGKGTSAGPPANVPGQITIQVRVPYRVVGLVVGPKGATIKHIQQQTHTYIVTPSRDKEPVFEVTGMPDNVQSARRQIEAHIALRTGNPATALNGLNSGLLNDLSSSNSGLSSLLNSEDTPEILASLYKNGLGSLFGYLDGGNNPQDMYNNVTACANGIGKNDMGVVNMLPSSAGSSTCSSNSSTSSSSSKSAIMTLPELINIWKRNDTTSVDIDEGLGESPNIWSMPTPSIIGSSSSPAASVSPTDSLLASFNCKNTALISNGININTLVGLNGIKGVVNPMNGNMNGVGSILCGPNKNQSTLAQQQRECIVCGDKEVTAALVPCGHNMFCLDCANRISASGESACPICSETVIQAIRIIA